jgi:hypothetical protein
MSLHEEATNARQHAGIVREDTVLSPLDVNLKNVNCYEIVAVQQASQRLAPDTDRGCRVDCDPTVSVIAMNSEVDKTTRIRYRNDINIYFAGKWIGVGAENPT